MTKAFLRSELRVDLMVMCLRRVLHRSWNILAMYCTLSASISLRSIVNFHYDYAMTNAGVEPLFFAETIWKKSCGQMLTNTAQKATLPDSLFANYKLFPSITGKNMNYSIPMCRTDKFKNIFNTIACKYSTMEVQVLRLLYRADNILHISFIVFIFI